MNRGPTPKEVELEKRKCTAKGKKLKSYKSSGLPYKCKSEIKISFHSTTDTATYHSNEKQMTWPILAAILPIL